MTTQIKSIIITGAGSGIGRSLARQMADAGVHVLAIGRRLEALEETASHYPDKIKPLSADVSLQSDINSIYTEAVSMTGPLAIFHGAGIYHISKLTNVTTEDWLKSFNINVTARLMLTRKLLPLLQSGRILFIGSDAGKTVREGAGTYSVAQSASETLVEAMKLELTSDILSIGLFKPGLVETDMVDTFLKAPKEEFPAVDFYRDWIAKGQITSAENVAAFAKWLLLSTEHTDFSNKKWDIREEWHHCHWLKGNLYKSSALE